MRNPLVFLKRTFLPRKVSQSSRKPGSKTSTADTYFHDWPVSTNPLDLPGEEPTSVLVGYVRWIPEHSDVLISRVIAACPGTKFIDLAIFSGQENMDRRKAITQAAEREPVKFRRLVLSKLLSLKRRGLKVVILTLDWTAPLREIVFACRSLGIKTILVPHESVFSTEDTFYYQKRRKTNAPLTDFVLCWGGLQSSIFIERGYPSSRIIKVGSPKLDYDVTYKSTLSREQFLSLFGLDCKQKVIVFAMQPMDNYADKKYARQRQASAISDILDYCQKNNLNFLVRTPPSREQILPTFLLQKLTASPNVAFDVAGQYILSPEETIAHADLVASVNSTMLFEARLMETPSIAMKYIDVPSIWENTDIPMAHSQLEFSFNADRLLSAGKMPLSAEARKWAEEKFCAPEFGFDGKSFDRISSYIGSIINDDRDNIKLDLRRNGGDGSVFFPSSIVVPEELIKRFTSEKLADALAVEKVFDASSLYTAAGGDIFVSLPELDDAEFESIRIQLGRDLIHLSEADIAEMTKVPEQDAE